MRGLTGEIISSESDSTCDWNKYREQKDCGANQFPPRTWYIAKNLNGFVNKTQAVQWAIIGVSEVSITVWDAW
ncbi:hypothetical protein TNCV_4994831 [Trichonephila clavipes]|nr:hypothetical protein TNCV_4994831 [Trichonephila clavipes]